MPAAQPRRAADRLWRGYVCTLSQPSFWLLKGVLLETAADAESSG